MYGAVVVVNWIRPFTENDTATTIAPPVIWAVMGMVAPCVTVAPLTGEMIVICGGMPIVTAVDPEVPSLKAVMITTPFETACTKPSDETVATAGLLLV